MKSLGVFTLCSVLLLMAVTAANAQLAACGDQGSWTTLELIQNNDLYEITAPYLLMDGRVLVQTSSSLGGTTGLQSWFALTPSTTANGSCPAGSYATGSGTLCGTWSPATGPGSIASLDTVWGGQYGPAAFAGAVLPDGKLIIEGGEGNIHCTQDCDQTDGAIYDPVANTWTEVNPPTSFNTIGDAPSAVLGNGTFLLGDPCNFNTALFDEATLSWNTFTAPTGKQGFPAEASFTLLPGGSVITVDTCWPGQPCSTSENVNNSEVYNPTTNAWSSLGNTPARLYSYGPGQANSCDPNNGVFGEQGPPALLPNGTYWATGGIQSPGPPSATHTATYTTAQGWQAAPDLPTVTIGTGSYGLQDGDQGSAILPDGNVLLATNPAGYSGAPINAYLIEYQINANPTAPYCQVSSPLGAGQYNMLVLPTGQVFVTGVYSGGEAYYVYTPGGSVYPNIAPTVNSGQFPNGLVIGTSYTVTGTRFNGADEGSFFGDDFNNSTNYPLVQITNNTTHDVFHARTYSPNAMYVATGGVPTYTHFVLPSNTETGASTLTVIANGIASNGISVTVEAAAEKK